MTDTNKERAGRFTKRPVTVDAVQYTEAVRDAYLFDGTPLPAGVYIPSRTLHPPTRTVRSADAYIDTLEGRMNVAVGDWVITGVKGERYPCKPDIFEATYERASLSAEAEPAATIKSWTNGSYWRNYKVEWHRNDLPEGANLYLAAPAQAPAPGWVSVPVHLTDAMHAAMDRAFTDAMHLGTSVSPDAWAAALAAAPSSGKGG